MAITMIVGHITLWQNIIFNHEITPVNNPETSYKLVLTDITQYCYLKIIFLNEILQLLQYTVQQSNPSAIFA
ncbi:unnamed protein product [Paramecium octaurelia]|uniref:Uncharacterized protein n=1 Tax=Paramecium octaurelia TaxID=43137 RepID=A0A8S1W8F4_PAROT|nr:unnamed protein product [Paramecium octaurelia]